MIVSELRQKLEELESDGKGNASVKFSIYVPSRKLTPNEDYRKVCAVDDAHVWNDREVFLSYDG